MYWDYPELYYRVYPKIIQSINTHLGETYTYENIPESKINDMVDEVYWELIKECPEIDSDPIERRGRGSRTRVAQRIVYGRGRIVRDLITIFLISELLRRNRIEGYSSPINPYLYPL